MSGRTWLGILLSALLGTGAPSPDAARGPAGPIAVLLWHDSPNDLKALAGLKRGLVALDLVEGLREIHAQGDADVAQQTLEACERDGVRLVVALGTRAALLAVEHLATTPIVFSAVTNPVSSGVVPSWDGSGSRVAGNSNWLDRRDMLAAFRLAVPDMKRLCVLSSAGNAVSLAEVAEARETLAADPGLVLVNEVVQDSSDLDRVLAAAVADADAIWVPIDFQLYQEEPLRRIVRAADDAGIPVVSSSERCAGAGALIVVTVDYELLGLKAASIVKRILLDGQDPGTIPVGRLTSSRIYVDLEAARRIDTLMPLDLVLKAYRVFGRKDGR